MVVAYLRRLSSIVLACLARRVLYVAHRLVCGAFGLVDFAFGLPLLIARHLADCVLHRALGLIVGAFHMLFVHRRFLSHWYAKKQRWLCRAVPSSSMPQCSLADCHDGSMCRGPRGRVISRSLRRSSATCGKPDPQ